MEFNIYHQSSIWKEARNKRTVSFVRILSYAMIILALQWSVVTWLEHIYLLSFASIAVAAFGGLVLKLLSQNKLLISKILILIIATCYFLIACIFASGYGTNHGSAHFWFITMAIVSYFLLYDLRIYREICSLTFLTFFFLFHFGYAPFHPLIFLSAEKNELIHRLDTFTALLTFFFVTRQFVIEITKSEEALTVSADKLEGLVESMLPKSIADRLRLEGKTFADEFHDCSILFADIVGFTSWSDTHTPNEVVDRLNEVFSGFDDAVEKMNLTKIKTSGDCYMVASGIPEFRADHAVVLTSLAIELQQIATQYKDFKFRIGINSGSVVAGVIGKKIFIYDVWGDTVNTASRLESNSEIGKINISDATYKLIKEKFNCSYRGKINAKNKGEIDMYFVDGEK